MALGRPVYAPGTADGTTASAVAAPGFAAYGGLAQMFTPLTGVCILFGTSGVKREILQ